MARTSPASASAVALLGEFVRIGVTDIVVSPGSRSQALALAAAELERIDAVRLHVRVDERTAGFLGLGLGAESDRPALVITTSGTAVANLHPAVLEAHHSGVPLIVLSADRPAEMRGIRSNQTTMQPGIFAGAVRLERDVAAPEGDANDADAAARLAREAAAAALGHDADGRRVPHPGAGPVHLNLQFREPLAASVRGAFDAMPERVADRSTSTGAMSVAVNARWGAAKDRRDAGPRGCVIEPGPLTIVVAGARAGAAAETFARNGGWPLIAEVSSGAHFGPNLVVAYRELLADPEFGGRVERVIVFGHPTLSREVPELIQRGGVETIVVAASGVEWYNPGRRVRQFQRVVRAEPRTLSPDERAWVGSWVHRSRAIVEAGLPHVPEVRSGIDETGHVGDVDAQRVYMKAQLATMRAPVTRRLLVDAVWASTWPHDRLVFGSSRLIRSADRAVPGRRVRTHANRGLAGIDGTIATAFGVAIASQEPPRASNGAHAAPASPTLTDEQHAPEAGATMHAAPFDSALVRAAADLDAKRPDAASMGATRVLVGDLSVLHDAGSLLLVDGEAHPRIQLIIGNDGGGTIFDSLEVSAIGERAAFDRVQYTPQSVDFSALAAAYGWGYVRATTKSELDEALGTAITGPSIIEVPLER